MNTLELRTTDLKKLITAFEKERDTLLDQVQYLKGNADRMEWVIRVLTAQLAQIEKEEEQRLILAAQQEKALETAHQNGNISAHPSVRSTELAERKQPESEVKKKQKKPL